MEHIISSKKLLEADVSLNKNQQSFDKNYTLDEMYQIMWLMEIRPNILVKSGKNAKWYVKWIDPTTIEYRIAKQKKFRNLKGYVMWIIEW
jgi:hypothetical protein